MNPSQSSKPIAAVVRAPPRHAAEPGWAMSPSPSSRPFVAVACTLLAHARVPCSRRPLPSLRHIVGRARPPAPSPRLGLPLLSGVCLHMRATLRHNGLGWASCSSLSLELLLSFVRAWVRASHPPSTCWVGPSDLCPSLSFLSLSHPLLRALLSHRRVLLSPSLHTHVRPTFAHVLSPPLTRARMHTILSHTFISLSHKHAYAHFPHACSHLSQASLRVHPRSHVSKPLSSPLIPLLLASSHPHACSHSGMWLSYSALAQFSFPLL
ncbi:hypothetical protein AMTRI_Chr13g90270 [Amborella trichopoda]